MTLCKDCRHYSGDETGNCHSPKWKKGYSAVPDDDGVAVESDEEWGMWVGPEFGCIHGEPKGSE